MRFVRLPGLVPYQDALELQRELCALRGRSELGHDVTLLLEHEETITIGRTRGSEANVLNASSVPVVPVERGGDVTWHGPGQLVAYPILKLHDKRRDLLDHLRRLEQGVIDLCADLGLVAGRDERNTGVWLPGSPSAQKVCSIGIACKRWVTLHGLALNISNKLERFEAIHPCGFEASVMTRLADHLDHPPPVDALQPRLARCLAAALGVDHTPIVQSPSLDPTIVAELVDAS